MAEVFQEMSGYAKTELAKVAEEARAKGVTVRETVVQGKPSAEIARVASEEKIDMIVLAPTARGCWTRRSSGRRPSAWCGARPARC
jgi:nucleotide-binding universal stress UspA family protein